MKLNKKGQGMNAPPKKRRPIVGQIVNPPYDGCRIGPLVALFTLFSVILLAACSTSDSPAATPIAFQPTATLPATPTLINDALANANAPTPPVTPKAGEMAADVATTTVQIAGTVTATPPAAERLELGGAALAEENAAVAIEQFRASLESQALTETQKQTALYNLGVAYLQDAKYAEAAEAFQQRLTAGGRLPDALHFELGQALSGTGDIAGAISAYETYLAANTDTGAYVGPIIGQAYLEMGDRAAAVAVYETAVTAPAHRLTETANRIKLAEFYRDDGNYADAIAQYEAVSAIAQTEVTKGQMAYLAGYAELLAGNTDAAYERYQTAVNQYPAASESYQALVALLDKGMAVDEFQRGLIDFNVGAYQPGIEAFLRYIGANPENYRQDTHLYLAWSYEGIGDLETALAQLESYAATDPAKATLERAKLLARSGDAAGAQAAYQSYVANYPGGEDAPFAAWWAAAGSENAGDHAGAIADYITLADVAPFHLDAPEALFRAGWLAYWNGDDETAVSLWERSAKSYPASEFGNASLVWLLRILPEMIASVDESGGGETAVVTDTIVLTDTTSVASQGEATPPPAPTAVTAVGLSQLLAEMQTQASSHTLETYYAVRARDMVAETPPFATPPALTIPAEDKAAQAEAEAWLKTQFNLETEDPLYLLSPQLAYDQRRIVGEKLWQIGLFESAKRELESLRQDFSGDPLLSYQLALYFRDLGLYRSSIIAAQSVLNNAGVSVFDAPKFIGRLSYPAYYADLILPLAERYGYDPLLHFALVRQESLFESFARSSAAAQGLSQVIPDTGAFIAQRLNWPNYDNDDLYKPYVGLTFGAYYLDQQLDAFDGTVHAALAAYNAGPGNAIRWYEIAGNDLDLFEETMDFAETRKYIDRIYLGQAVYRFLYGNSQ